MTIRDHLAFTLALHRAIAPDATRNSCWSPFSVASALGLAAVGAAGTTREELAAALLGAGEGNLDEQAKLLAVGAELDPAGHNAEPPTLAVSNTMWTRKNVQLEPDFTAELERWPGGAVRGAPFDTDPEQARHLINTDVATTTHDLIPELIPPGVITTGTLAALVNALYLKAAWFNEFPKSATKPAPFHAPTGTRPTDTMRLTKRLGYAARHGWQVVTLGAHGGLHAAILLPDGDLAAAESALTADTLADLLTATSTARASLWLPKLDVTARSELAPALAQIGVRTLFTDHADLSGISATTRLKVSAVLHEAVLRVDEQGFEGAAATAMVFLAAAMVREEEPIEVRVDRPFLFLVRRNDGPVYFLARVTDPS